MDKQAMKDNNSARVELLPCPLCGFEVDLIRKEESNLWVFKCPDESPCIGSWVATYAHGDHLPEAISAWNTRTPQPPESGLREALTWYGDQARLARLVHSEGDPGRQALAADGGKRALTALTNSAPAADQSTTQGEATGEDDRSLVTGETAADRIATLTAERDALRAYGDMVDGCNKRQFERLSTAQQTIAVLREALKKDRQG